MVAWPTSAGTIGSLERYAESLDTNLAQLVSQLTAFRAEQVGHPSYMASQRVREVYTVVAASRLNGAETYQKSGLADAYARRYPTVTGFDPATEWPAINTAINDLLTWFTSNIPSDGSGHLALDWPQTETRVLSGYNIAITAQQQSDLVGFIDAVLTKFQ